MQKVVKPLVIKALFVASMVLGCTGFSVAAEPASADPMAAEQQKSREEVKELITAVLELSEEEGVKFWPLFEEYREKIRDINDQVLDMIVEYSDARKEGGLADERALEMVDATLNLDATKNQIKKEYFEQFKKVLPAAKVVRLFQVDRRVDIVSHLFMARHIPLFHSQEVSDAPAAK